DNGRPPKGIGFSTADLLAASDAGTTWYGREPAGVFPFRDINCCASSMASSLPLLVSPPKEFIPDKGRAVPIGLRSCVASGGIPGTFAPGAYSPGIAGIPANRLSVVWVSRNGSPDLRATQSGI